MDSTRKMNGKPIAVHSDSDESYDLPRNFSAEMNRKCGEFLDKRGLRTQSFLKFNIKNKGGAK